MSASKKQPKKAATKSKVNKSSEPIIVAKKKFSPPKSVYSARHYASLRGVSEDLLVSVYGRQQRNTLSEWDRLWAELMSRPA